MANSIVRVWNDKKIRHRADGFMSLTDMAQATGKKLNDWLRLKSTKDYLEELSIVAGIPVTNLIEIAQGGKADAQGTWGHRRVAIRLAQWCSSAFAVQVDSWVEDLMANGVATVENRFPDNTIGKVETDPVLEGVSHISAAIDCIFATIGMKPQLVAGIKTEAIAANYPQYRPALEAAKSSLTLSLPSSLLTPTKLAELWNARTGENLTARSMNKLLEDRKLQRKTGQENPSWEAIGLGLDHSELTANTAKGHAKTVQAVRWHKSVIDLLV